MQTAIIVVLHLLVLDPEVSADAVYESAPGICPPHGATIAQLDRIIADYLASGRSASGTKQDAAIQALRSAWPCRRLT